MNGDTRHIAELSLKEQAIIMVFCLLAFIRVSIFLAAFPFFANVDEGLHFDLVVKYSEGHFPHGIETISPKTAHLLAIYSSPEFMNKPEHGPNGRFPLPAWKQPPDAVPENLPPPAEYWLHCKNFESGQMPLYYVVAGCWMRLGQLIGFDEDLILLSWIRFLNAFIAAALVWISYVVARSVFPGRPLLRIAVPMLVAFLPQDAFYQMQNDVLSPLCFGLLFLCVLKTPPTEIFTLRRAVMTGVAFAATYLVKTSNLPLLAVVGCVLLWRFYVLMQAGKLREARLPFVIMTCCALVPILLWTAWLKHAFGDFTGSSAKITLLGWTSRSFLEWFNHPIFSLHGAWAFWQELLASFWRGEFTWHKVRLALPGVDLFYALSSTVLIVAALISLRSRSMEQAKGERQLYWFSFSCCLALVLFYALLSVMFDFGTSPYPSRAFPYFASGRLMIGALIPFFLLYVRGLDWLCSFTRRRWPFAFCVVLFVMVMLVSEIVMTGPVFASEFNLYHF